MYRASNGIMSKVLSETEAREHYDRAQFVSGEFGEVFVTCAVGEYGRLLSVAATTYTPIQGLPEPEKSDPEAAGLDGPDRRTAGLGESGQEAEGLEGPGPGRRSPGAREHWDGTGRRRRNQTAKPAVGFSGRRSQFSENDSSVDVGE